MLRRNLVQEQLSRAYIRAVSARAGCVVNDISPDYGIDLELRYLTSLPDGRLHDLGRCVGIQAKATTRAELVDTFVQYDLEARAYQNLTARCGSPRILVLYTMPEDDAAWLEADERQLVLRTGAYWHHLRGSPGTENERTVRIRIPRTQRFDVDAVQGPLMALATRRKPSR